MEEKKRGHGKVIHGTVRSNKMDKTVVVEVNTKQKHSVYGKYVRRRHRFFAHDARNECTVGDFVEIIESRPLSTKKRWRVIKILKKAEVA